MRRAPGIWASESSHISFSRSAMSARSRTLGTPTDVAQEIFRTVWELLESARGGQRLRLVGVRLEGLTGSAGSARQPALDEPEHTWRDAEVAADAVWARFGKGAVGPASLVRRRSEGSG